MSNSEVLLGLEPQLKKDDKQKLMHPETQEKPLLTRSALWLMTIDTGRLCTGLAFYCSGDMMRRKKLILSTFFLMTIALLAMTMAPNLGFLYVASFLVGFTSVVPQMFVPMAAEMATPEKRNSGIGMVMSGLLLGILLSRVVAGFVGELWGWKMIYYIAAAVMVILAVLISVKLSGILPSFKGRCSGLMTSLVHLVKTQPVLRLAAFGFAGFVHL